ncbi:MAG TPA: prepilin-type N-terminal cleavage/methylation domain-containing protein [Verrucomicrobiae bacterium]|nr:prepilin-type N-terminal cleavage/methylation domain-containing protein [Verrucomicrobiae bacterium]
MKFEVRTPNRGGFTLIEVVIAASLMALILVAGYLCLNAGLASQKTIEPRTEVIQNARVAMAIMVADLRGACPLSKDAAFLGMQRMLGEVEADNLDFATHNYTPRRPREGDYCQESFYISEDPRTRQFSLWRRRNPLIALDPLSGGSKEEVATGVVGLRFEYFDGTDWYDNWGEIKKGKLETTHRDQPNLTGMPTAVRITLLLDSNPKSKAVSETGERVIEKPLAFQSVVQLELAANELENGSKTPTSNNNSDTSDTQGAPNGQNF